MEVFTSIFELQAAILDRKVKNVGFVPTMGALHNGHLSLIKIAKDNNDLVVCSVFVNPTQFNNVDDLKIYPRNLAKDIDMLLSAGCDILFAPSVEEIYPAVVTNEILDTNFGTITQVMEAKHRPGHFDGVVKVVKRLFEIVKPNNAYFGDKDYQQLCVVKALVKRFEFNINIVGCPILRENDGLAMSSRNMNLSVQERNAAALIPKTLFSLKEKAKLLSLLELTNWVKSQFENHAILKLEYFELAKEDTLEPISNLNSDTNIRAFIVVYAGKTRLIDNLKIS